MVKNKRLLIIGGSGTIGQILNQGFRSNYEILNASRSSGEFRVDITSEASIKNLFSRVGLIDGLICAAGDTKWDYMSNLTSQDYNNAWQSKLMGQISISRTAVNYIIPGGSITLTSGILGDCPLPLTTAAAMVNGGINSFVRAAALELSSIRINAVSSDLVVDSFRLYKQYFINSIPVQSDQLITAYKKSVETSVTGGVIRVGYSSAIDCGR